MSLGTKSKDEGLLNDLSGEGEVMIPTDDAPSYLKLKFNTKAYRQISTMTGMSHFERLLQQEKGNISKVADIDFLIAAIFAGSRKYHPDITLNEIVTAIEDLLNQQLQQLWKATILIWTGSLSGPADKKVKTDKVPLETTQATTEPTSTGSAS